MTWRDIKLILTAKSGTNTELMDILDNMNVSEIRTFILKVLNEKQSPFRSLANL